MGTAWSVQLPALPAAPGPDELAARVQAELDRLDRGIFSTWVADSELSRFNRSPPGIDFPVSPELIDAILLAQEVHALSGGAFDMTIAPLVELWGFGPSAPQVVPPDPRAIEAARARLNSAAVSADRARGVLRKTEAVRIDLSALAKGLAADKVALLLEGWGITDYLVDIGGELRSRGGKAPGKPWVLAIESPRADARRAARLLALPSSPLAVAGAGDYRNFFELDGVRYSHEINPRSGRPIAHALAAVTVFDTSAARADALATALMVLGPEAGMALAESVIAGVGGEGDPLAGGPGIAAYLIMRADQGDVAVESAAFTRIFKSAGTPASRQ